MDKVDVLREWLVRIGGDEWAWFAKRLSANDTGLTQGHQVGFYVPREFALSVAAELGEAVLNPRRELQFWLISHDQQSSPSLTYYNSRVVRKQPNGRNEFRVTGFGGQGSALQDPESTGSILITAWHARSAHVEAWLTDALDEEEAAQAVVGPVEPSTVVVRVTDRLGQITVSSLAPATCEPAISELPQSWATTFPPGRALTDEAIRRRSGQDRAMDDRLLDRYRCEFGLFKVVESAHVLPLIGRPFASVEDFLAVAQTVANRRKARAGRSLELHLAAILDEERVSYEAGATTEGNRRPDFVFPSISAYRSGRPTRMLGVKTSVKERWRQILDEAANIPEKHLFTLSEGVSIDQFTQMQEAGVRLVVPGANISRFPVAVRPHLLRLSDFVALVR